MQYRTKPKTAEGGKRKKKMQAGNSSIYPNVANYNTNSGNNNARNVTSAQTAFGGGQRKPMKNLPEVVTSEKTNMIVGVGSPINSPDHNTWLLKRL